MRRDSRCTCWRSCCGRSGAPRRGPPGPATAAAAAEAAAAGRCAQTTQTLARPPWPRAGACRGAPGPGATTGADTAETGPWTALDAAITLRREPNGRARGRPGAGVRASGHPRPGVRALRAAARLDPREARRGTGSPAIWRDWGFPHFGLGDAYRAVWAAPRSPLVHNTLGTILQFLGKGATRGRSSRRRWRSTPARRTRRTTSATRGCWRRTRTPRRRVRQSARDRSRPDAGAQQPRARQGHRRRYRRRRRRSSARPAARRPPSTTSGSSTFPSAATRLPPTRSTAPPA